MNPAGDISVADLIVLAKDEIPILSNDVYAHFGETRKQSEYTGLRFSRGGYKPGDWRKTFTFGKAARGEAEQTNGGLAAGEERRRWEENPVDERIPEWDAPQRNPNIAKPFAVSITSHNHFYGNHNSPN